MVSPERQESDPSGYTRGELVLWFAFLAAGILLLFAGVIPATEEGRQTRIQLHDLERETRQLERERDQSDLRREGLLSDPDMIRQGLIDRGFTPKGATRVVEERSRGR